MTDYSIRRDVAKVIKLHEDKLMYQHDSVTEEEELILTNRYSNIIYTFSKLIVVVRYLPNETVDEQVFLIPYVILTEKGVSEEDQISNLLLDYSNVSKYLLENWSGEILKLDNVEGWYQINDTEMYRIKNKESMIEEGDTPHVKAAKWILTKSDDIIVDEATNKKIANFRKQMDANSISEKKLREIGSLFGADIKLIISMNGEEKIF